MKKSQVYIVATPIGNMEDISKRALDILSEVDYIACEDTRVTKKLLDRYKICAKTFAYHKYNEKVESQKVLDILSQGKTIALVSDAGTPCICDPGKILLKTLYENNIKIEAVAGACAVSTFLSLIPREDEAFSFIGFLDKSAAKQKEIFEQFKNTDTIFYESPNRLVKTLENIKLSRGEQTKVAIGRELTKIHEEIFIDYVEKAIEHYTKNPPKGEIAAMIFKNAEEKTENSDILKNAEILLKQGFSKKDVIKILVNLFDVNKNELYKTLNY